ncbi:MAG: hypothetical protein JW810_03600 [Sedimentisphaerales bacterium]|nr:hypothetical protein [Sedimentisphaerales bacterium]
MKEFVNATELTLAADWICRKMSRYDTRRLRLHLKRHRRKDQIFSGYCRYSDFLVVAAVHQRLPLPFSLAKPVASRPNRRRRCGFDYIWQEMTIATEDQALVWIAGHECYHFLCKTRQLSGNWETRANRYGFECLAEFSGEHPVQLPLFEKCSPSARARSHRRPRVIYG